MSSEAFDVVCEFFASAWWWGVMIAYSFQERGRGEHEAFQPVQLRTESFRRVFVFSRKSIPAFARDSRIPSLVVLSNVSC